VSGGRLDVDVDVEMVLRGAVAPAEKELKHHTPRAPICAVALVVAVMISAVANSVLVHPAPGQQSSAFVFAAARPLLKVLAPAWQVCVIAGAPVQPRVRKLVTWPFASMKDVGEGRMAVGQPVMWRREAK